MPHPNPKEVYGSLVFNEHVMKERLPAATYRSLKATLQKGQPLDIELANVVASFMRDWAIEKGATHYTHWFQSLTGITSEKHDSFISPMKDGTAIMEFSGKELVRGESDASSFPSGGLRATAEARGYTTWDPTSYAFVKDGTLCIPTAFCSWTGEALDEKTPLLRSMKAVSDQACRILKLFGKDIAHVDVTVGLEQEYFLIKKEHYEQREDLILTGRTLFGAAPAKGQELEEHYFGALRPEVSAFMHELDEELWKLGVGAKTKHNEVAPAQHELAPLFDRCNVAVDHNLLTMEFMRRLAPKHGLVCLLHEKPFEGVNGSGKHNNWSLSAPGMNLLDPGDTPMDNLQFLIFFAAVIRAVDEYQDLLRMCIASAGNEHRLGGNEAPPAIVSVFVGDDLAAILDAIASDSQYVAPEAAKIDLGVDVLPKFAKDTTDRNRTSPFAFTGNKFEFRMPGSSLSVSGPNVVLNTAVAQALREFYDELKDAAPDGMDAAVHELVKRAIKKHKKVIFNGNGYTDEWLAEAERRGLYNLRSTPEALPCMVAEKNIRLFTAHHIFTEGEVRSRYAILLENYCKTLHVEAKTMGMMVRGQFLPAVLDSMDHLAASINGCKAAAPAASCAALQTRLEQLAASYGKIDAAQQELEAALDRAEALGNGQEAAWFYHDEVLPAMDDVRSLADAAEVYLPAGALPYPDYSELLFSV